MRKTLHSLFLSCLKAGLLVEKQQLTPLTTSECIQLQAHLLLCRGCKAYKTQSHLISKSIKEKMENDGSNIRISAGELESIKAQILSRLF